MPPFDERQIIYATSFTDHAITITIALIIAIFALRVRRGSMFLYTLAACIALTSPLISVSSDAVWGAFPTIDKEGSLLFYREGVHFQLGDFSNPAHRLIGFHLGHLWITQLFDFFVGDIGGFNLQALLNITLTWYCTYRLLLLLGAKQWWAWLLASQIGLHLHLFRDIQFYTIEKSAIYPLLMYWEATIRTANGSKKASFMMGLTFFLSSWINLYWGIFCVLLTGPILWIHRKKNHRNMINGIGLCIVLGIAIAVYQQLLTVSGPPFAHSVQFTERAALDNFSVWPLSWNRLPWYTSISPLIMFGVGWAWRKHVLHTQYIGTALLFFVLSLGPFLMADVPNPLYQLLSSLPALWRFAKPEAFFFLTFIAILTTLVSINPSKRSLYLISVLILIQWTALRTQNEYPSFFSVPIQTTLPKNWERRVFTMEESIPIPKK